MLPVHKHMVLKGSHYVPHAIRIEAGMSILETYTTRHGTCKGLLVPFLWAPCQIIMCYAYSTTTKLIFAKADSKLSSDPTASKVRSTRHIFYEIIRVHRELHVQLFGQLRPTR